MNKVHQIVVLSSDEDHSSYHFDQQEIQGNNDPPVQMIEEILSDDEDVQAQDEIILVKTTDILSPQNDDSSKKRTMSMVSEVVDIEEISDESSDLEYLDNIESNNNASKSNSSSLNAISRLKKAANGMFIDNNNVSITTSVSTTHNLRRTFSDILATDTSSDRDRGDRESHLFRNESAGNLTNKRLKMIGSSTFNNAIDDKDDMSNSAKKERGYYFDKLFVSSLNSSSPTPYLKRYHSVATTTPTKSNGKNRSIIPVNDPQVLLNSDQKYRCDEENDPSLNAFFKSPSKTNDKQKKSIFNERYNFSSSLPTDPIEDPDNSFDFMNKNNNNNNNNNNNSDNMNSITMNDRDYKNYILSQFTKRDLNKANKSRLTKIEKLTEMNINIDSGFSKSFGLTLDSLKDSMNPSNLRLMNLDEAVNEDFLNRTKIKLSSMHGVDIELGKKVPIGKSVISHDNRRRFPNVDFITWTRTCDKIYSKKLRCFLPTKDTFYLLEDKLGIYYQSEKFFLDYKSGEFFNLIRCLKENYPFKQFILFLKDYQQFHSKTKRKESKQYAEKIRSNMGGSSTNSRKNASANEILFSSEEMEDILIDIQINHQIYNFVINVTSELFGWLKNITYSMASCLYRKANYNEGDDAGQGANGNETISERHIGKVKSGNDSFESYQLALEQIKYVTRNSAGRISDKYTSMMMLYDVSSHRTSLGRDSAGDPLVNSRIDSTILKLFKSSNPDELIYE